MKRAPFQRLLSVAFTFGILPLMLFAGCYSPETAGPNVSPGKRVVFPGEGEPVTGGVPMNPPVVPPGQPTEPNQGETGSRIGIGDQLTISFSDVPQGAMPPVVIVKVGSDGTITLPHNRVLRALGTTPPELQRDIRNAYVPSLFVNLTAIVKAEDRVYFVSGEVRLPTRQFHTGTHITVLRAIDTSGGFTDFSNKKKIEVRRAATGKTEWVNWEKARKDPKLDLPVFPNDQIIVHKRIF